MKSLCVATPLLAAMVMGLPAVASASGRGVGVHERVGHVQVAGQPGGPTQVVAQQPSGSVRRPPEGGSSGGSSGGGSGSGTTSGTASGRSGGGGDSGGGSSGGGSSSGAVSRGESRRGGDDGGSQWGNNRAVPRSSARRARPNSYPYYYYRPNPWYYDRWGYGGFGLGYFYYSPWSWYGPGYYPGGGWSRDDGGVRLKVKPRDAEVLVDGYYAGVVDDFDGSFQSLKLDAGSYRIEVRKPGFESLGFDVRVQRDRTITFRGEMKSQP